MNQQLLRVKYGEFQKQWNDLSIAIHSKEQTLPSLLANIASTKEQMQFHVQ